MANNNGDSPSNGLINALSANTITANANAIYATTAGYDSLYDNTIYPNGYTDDATIEDVSGRQMLEIMQKGIYRTLVNRRDEAKALWEEEDDDASYGEYKALKDAVELLDQFIKQAPMARYSGLQRDHRYDRYGRNY